MLTRLEFKFPFELFFLFVFLLFQAANSEHPFKVIKNPLHVCELLGEFQSETISERVINSKINQDPFKTIEISVPEISQITGTLMPDTNPEIIKNSLLYDFTEVVRCEDCDSVLDQNLSYFYLKCLLRKLDCFSEVLHSSCLLHIFICIFQARMKIYTL